MSGRSRARFGTIRGRLLLGFTALIALLLVAGVLARRTMMQMSTAVGATLEGVQEEARQSAALSGDVAQTLEAASSYVETRDTIALTAFRRYGWDAHRVQREMNARLGRSSDNSERKDQEATIDAVTDEMADSITVTGSLEECAEKLDERRALGVDLPVVSLPSGDARRVERVLSALMA